MDPRLPFWEGAGAETTRVGTKSAAIWERVVAAIPDAPLTDERGRPVPALARLIVWLALVGAGRNEALLSLAVRHISLLALIKKAEEVAANPNGQMRFLPAVNRFMSERGEKLVNARGLETFFDWLVDEIGEDTPLVEITSEKVTKLIAKRESMTRWGRSDTGPVTPLYAQRAVVDRLQSLCTWAKDNWEVFLPREPKWSKWYVDIDPRTKTMTYAEEERIMSVAGDMAPLLLFSLLSGVRRADALIRWSQVDFDARTIKISVKKKRGTPHEVRITKGIAKVLESVRGHHEEFVFTNTHECRERAKQRIPITYKSFHYFFEKVCRRAGVKGLTIHDLRRTAGERMYRATGDIAAVSKFLGHAKIDTTRKFYVHVILDDVEERQVAMENARLQVMEERRLRSLLH